MMRHTLARHAAVAVARTARALDRLVARLSLLAVPPPAVMERAVVADGIAQGRADLQLVHGAHEGDELLAAMYADPEHPLRRAADADLRRRAEALRRTSRDLVRPDLVRRPSVHRTEESQ